MSYPMSYILQAARANHTALNPKGAAEIHIAITSDRHLSIMFVQEGARAYFNQWDCLYGKVRHYNDEPALLRLSQHFPSILFSLTGERDDP
jgi:hypothetical protein